MNALTILVAQYLSKNNLSRKDLAQLLGYSNISKSLRNLDQYCLTLLDKNQISNKLQKVLNIPEPEYIKAANKVRDSINNRERENFKPSIYIIPSSRPTPLIGANLLDIKFPEIPEGCEFKREIQILCEAFKKWQLGIKHNASLSQKEENDFNNFQKKVEYMIRENQSYIPYSIAKGFRYIKSYDECFIFDRKCNLLEHSKKQFPKDLIVHKKLPHP